MKTNLTAIHTNLVRLHSFSMRAILAPTLLALFSCAAHAVPVVFTGIDADAGPSDARPNSDGAAANFQTAAGLLGSVNTIDLESAPLGDFSGGNLVLDSVVTASASVGAAASVNDTFNDDTNGYPTSPDQMIWMSNIGSPNRTLSFNFMNPIQAFGAYITGLGTAGGSTINIDFNDGSAQNFQVTGDPTGGVLYWGFTSAGAQVSSISFTQDNSSDAFGVDDISYTTIPEPSSGVLVFLALSAIAFQKRVR